MSKALVGLLLWLVAEWLVRPQPSTSLCALGVFFLCLFAVRGAGRWTCRGRVVIWGGVQLLLTASTVHTCLQLCFPHGIFIQAGWETLFLSAVQHSTLCRIVHHLHYNSTTSPPCTTTSHVQAPKMSSAPPLAN